MGEGATKTCIYCGATGMVWGENEEGKFRLFDTAGNMHLCVGKKSRERSKTVSKTENDDIKFEQKDFGTPPTVANSELNKILGVLERIAGVLEKMEVHMTHPGGGN